MSRELVLSVIAADRPGLVQALSEIVADHGGNWVDSSMARLGSDFAGIVRISMPKVRLDTFKRALDNLRADGITVTVRDGSAIERHSGRWARFELTGGDQPGIVRDISTALSDAGVSIDEMTTRVEPLSMAGGNLFTAEGWLLVPDGVSLDKLRDKLERIASDIMVDLSLSEAGELEEV